MPTKCLIFFLIVASTLLSGCESLFYFPDDRMYVDVKKLEIQPQQIELQTSAGKKFFGWYFKASDKPNGKILFFHGNAQNRTSHFFALYWILKSNYDFFIFDYPGYADSEGRAIQETTTDSGSKALEWLTKQNPSTPLIIFGQSLGGNIALFTASKNKNTATPCLIVVDSTFKSYRKVAQRTLAKHWLTWPAQQLSYLFLSDSYSADTHISEISPTPLIVFHGEDDPVIDLENGKDIFAAAHEPKKFYLVPGRGHTMAFNGPNQELFRENLLMELKANCPGELSRQ